jgi:hypothetical protein
MTIAPFPGEIRRIVLRTFQEVGAEVVSSQDLRETILVDAGACMARTYAAGGYKAVWLLDEGTVRFTNEAGQLLRIVNLYEEMPAVRIAA